MHGSDIAAVGSGLLRSDEFSHATYCAAAHHSLSKRFVPGVLPGAIVVLLPVASPPVVSVVHWGYGCGVALCWICSSSCGHTLEQLWLCKGMDLGYAGILNERFYKFPLGCYYNPEL